MFLHQQKITFLPGVQPGLYVNEQCWQLGNDNHLLHTDALTSGDMHSLQDLTMLVWDRIQSLNQNNAKNINETMANFSFY